MLFMGVRCAESFCRRLDLRSPGTGCFRQRQARAFSPERCARGPSGGLAALALRRTGRRIRGSRLGWSRIARDPDNAVPVGGQLLLRPLLSGPASTLAPLQALWPDPAGLAAPQRCQAKDQMDFDFVLLADDLLFDRHWRLAMVGPDRSCSGRCLWDVVRGEAADRAKCRGPCGIATSGKARAVI